MEPLIISKDPTSGQLDGKRMEIEEPKARSQSRKYKNQSAYGIFQPLKLYAKIQPILFSDIGAGMRGFLPVVILSALLFCVLFASYTNAEPMPNADGSVEQQIHIKAEQGDATEQYNLGVMYANGKGVPQDDKQAAFWFRKAAEQGYAEAQLILGLMYNEGQGDVSKDYSQAVAWFRKAAEQGHGDAQYNLGLAYLGELADFGVQKDYKLAYAWFLVAEANGSEGNASGIRGSLERSLPPDVLKEGAELAKEYFEKYQPIQ